MLLYQEDAELLFPSRLIPTLRDLRGEEFRDLIDQLSQTDSEVDTGVLGFSLMMIRLASCLTCTADSYRAMNGCTACAMKTIRGYRGSDGELIDSFKSACVDVQEWMETGTTPDDLRDGK